LITLAVEDFATKAAASSAAGLTGLFGFPGAFVCGVAMGMLADHSGETACGGSSAHRP
jgi:sugar phosphate permease